MESATSIRNRRARARSLAILSVGLLGWLSCAGSRPTDIGVSGGSLAPCPSSPNCVSSDAPEGEHYIAPLPMLGDAEAAWIRVREVVAATPRTTIVTDDGQYLHAECESALMGYVDDLELHLRPADGEIAVRSASRLGYSDMGANRDRVEDLRSRLEAE